MKMTWRGKRAGYISGYGWPRKSVVHIYALKFYGLLRITLQILSRFQSTDFISFGYIRCKLHKITGVKMYDKVVKGSVARLKAEGYIEEFFVRTDRRKKIRGLRITKEGRIQLRLLREKKKKDPNLLWID